MKFSNLVKRATDSWREIIAIYVILLIAAAIAFSYFEGIHFLDSLYWAVVTALTVGFGDIAPQTAGGRIVAVVLIHSMAFFIAPIIIGRVFRILDEDRNVFTHEEQEEILAYVRSRK